MRGPMSAAKVVWFTKSGRAQIRNWTKVCLSLSTSLSLSTGMPRLVFLVVLWKSATA